MQAINAASRNAMVHYHSTTMLCAADMCSDTCIDMCIDVCVDMSIRTLSLTFPHPVLSTNPLYPLCTALGQKLGSELSVQRSQMRSKSRTAWPRMARHDACLKQSTVLPVYEVPQAQKKLLLFAQGVSGCMLC